MEDRTYEVTDKGIGQHIELGAGKISFYAENIRREMTGLHATVYIIYRGVIDSKAIVIGYDTFNVQRADPRGKLCRDSYKQVGAIFKADYSIERLQNDFTMFCIGLEDALLRNSNAEEQPGTEDPKGPNYILKPFVTENAGTILYGPPGRGKSFVAILMAISIDAGLTGFWPVQQRKVMFVNLERSKESVGDRIGMLNKRLGLEARRPLLTLNARGRSLAQIQNRCEYAVKQKGVEVVILDSVSRTGYGALNEDKTANSIIDTMSAICSTWVAIAHTPRADESHIFGSQMFDAGIDIGIQMLSQAEDDKLGVGLKITKSNYGKMVKEPYIIAFEFGEYLLTDVRPATRGEFTEIEACKDMGLIERVREYLRDCDMGKASAWDIADALQVNRGNVATILKNEKHFICLGRESGDRKVYYALKTDKESLYE